MNFQAVLKRLKNPTQMSKVIGRPVTIHKEPAVLKTFEKPDANVQSKWSFWKLLGRNERVSLSLFPARIFSVTAVRLSVQV